MQYITYILITTQQNATIMTDRGNPMPIKTLKRGKSELTYESEVIFNRLLQRHYIDAFFRHVLSKLRATPYMTAVPNIPKYIAH